MVKNFECNICKKTNFKNAKSLSNHRRWHNPTEKLKNAFRGENHPRWKNKIQNKCSDCGKNIYEKSKMCKSCFNKIRLFSKENREKRRLSKLGNKNPNWKGNEVGYEGLHTWIRRNKAKIKICENCNKNKSYDLANISGEYKREVEDFKWLCRKCHMEEDGRLDKLCRGIKNC